MINQPKMIRVATVKATGRKYIVQNCSCIYNPDNTLNTKLSRVHCWGELQSYRNLASRHGPSKTFVDEAVEIADVQKTVTLLQELFEQNISVLREEGYEIARTRRGNYKIYGRRTA